MYHFPIFQNVVEYAVSVAQSLLFPSHDVSFHLVRLNLEPISHLFFFSYLFSYFPGLCFRKSLANSDFFIKTKNPPKSRMSKIQPQQSSATLIDH